MRLTGKAKNINYRREVLGGVKQSSAITVSQSTQTAGIGFYWQGATNDATETEIFLDGISGARMVITADNIKMFSGNGYINDTDNNKFGFFSFEILITRDDSDNTVIQGYRNDIISIDSSLAGAYIQFRADDTTEALACFVKGLASTNISYEVVLNML